MIKDVRDPLRDVRVLARASADVGYVQRLRLHRLMHLDLRRFRQHRKRRNLERFRRHEPIEETFIAFESPSLEHVESARLRAIQD